MWDFLVRKNLIGAADYLLNGAARYGVLPVLDAADVAKFHARLEELQPDMLVSTADAVNKALGSYAELHEIPFFIYISDFGLFPDLIHPHATHLCYFEETAALFRGANLNRTYFTTPIYPETNTRKKAAYVLGCYRDLFRQKSPASGKIATPRFMATGPWAEKKHYHADASQAEGLRGRINPDYPTLLVASGGIGGRLVGQALRHLAKGLATPANLLIMCGRDEKLAGRIARNAHKYAPHNVIVNGFIDDFHHYMDAADIVVARPSGGVVIESLIQRKPLAVIGRVPSNDADVLPILTGAKAAEICPYLDALPGVVSAMLGRLPEYACHLDAFMNRYPADFEETAAGVLHEFQNALPALRPAPREERVSIPCREAPEGA